MAVLLITKQRARKPVAYGVVSVSYAPRGVGWAYNNIPCFQIRVEEHKITISLDAFEELKEKLVQVARDD